MRWTRILGFGLAGLCGLAGGMQPGAARAATVEEMGPEGQWMADCSMDRMTDTRTCRVLVYRLLGDASGAMRTAAISVVPVGKDYELFLTIDKGVVDRCALRVDRQPRLESTVSTISVCVFANFAADKVADSFRNGTTVLTRFTFKDGSQQDIDFPLKGFKQAFEEMARGLK
ncbi:hypothetical protein [Azospirillum sp. sgz301742]